MFITAADGTQYRYLHMSNVAVNVGDGVSKGNHIGRVKCIYRVNNYTSTLRNTAEHRGTRFCARTTLHVTGESIRKTTLALKGASGRPSKERFSSLITSAC